jgi:hypothetical protein
MSLVKTDAIAPTLASDGSPHAGDTLSEARGQQQSGNAAADDDDARGAAWRQLHE